MLKKARTEFKRMLTKSDLLQLSLAVYLGTVLQKFLESIVDGLFMPLLSRLLPISILHQKLQFLDAELDVGNIISNVVSMRPRWTLFPRPRSH